VLVLLGGSLGFVSALCCGDCESFFFGYVGRCRVSDAVGCEVAVFEVKVGFFGDFAEDISEAVFVVAVAVHCQPEGISAVVLLPCVAFVEPAFQDLTGFFFQRDYPVLPVLRAFFPWDTQYVVLGINPRSVGAFDFDRT